MTVKRGGHPELVSGSLRKKTTLLRSNEFPNTRTNSGFDTGDIAKSQHQKLAPKIAKRTWQKSPLHFAANSLHLLFCFVVGDFFLRHNSYIICGLHKIFFARHFSSWKFFPHQTFL